MRVFVMENERLTPQKKLELVQGMALAKNVSEYAAQVGIDRSYLYELRREAEDAMLSTWSQITVGRPPQPAPDPGRGMKAALEAQSRGVNPDEAGLVDSVFGWIKQAGVVAPAGNPFVAKLRQSKAVAIPAPGLKKELNPKGPPSNLMLDQANLAGLSCPVLWVGSGEVGGKWASMALATGADGIRRAAALKEGSVRELDVAEGLLQNLAERGLDAVTDMLVITEGSRTLDRALGQV